MIYSPNDVFCSSLSVTATGNATDVKDMGGDFDKGPGGQVKGVIIVIETAADYTSTNETYAFSLVTDDNTGLSSATTLSTTGTLNGNVVTAGTKYFLPLPNTNERYIGVTHTLGGTTPSVTYSAYYGTADEVYTGGVIYSSGLTY